MQNEKKQSPKKNYVLFSKRAYAFVAHRSNEDELTHAPIYYVGELRKAKKFHSVKKLREFLKAHKVDSNCVPCRVSSGIFEPIGSYCGGADYEEKKEENQ